MLKVPIKLAGILRLTSGQYVDTSNIERADLILDKSARSLNIDNQTSAARQGGHFLFPVEAFQNLFGQSDYFNF